MVMISAEERKEILGRFPNICIVRTVKQKSKRHRYYCEENPRAMRFLKELRGEPVFTPNNRPRGGGAGYGRNLSVNGRGGSSR